MLCFIVTNSAQNLDASTVDYFSEYHWTIAVLMYIEKHLLIYEISKSPVWSMSTNMGISTSFPLDFRAIIGMASLESQ